MPPIAELPTAPAYERPLLLSQRILPTFYLIRPLLVLLLFALAASLCVVDAVAVTRTSIGSGNWSSAGTWDTGVPQPGDDVIIQTFDVTLDADVRIGSLLIRSGSLAAGSRTLSLEGSWSKFGGRFLPGTGRVEFLASGEDTLLGRTDFFDLYNAPGDSLLLRSTITVARDLRNDGLLRAISDTIYIKGDFYGAGEWIEGRSTVFYNSSDTVELTSTEVTNYFNLTLADTLGSFSSRILSTDLLIRGSFHCDLRNRDSAGIVADADLRIGGGMIYVGASPYLSGQITFETLSSDSVGYLIVAPHAGSSHEGEFNFPKITIAKDDTTDIVRVGSSAKVFQPVFGDTLYVSAPLANDTAIVVRSGSLDLQRAFVRSLGSAKPVVAIREGARYRTGDTFNSPDSLTATLVLDTNSTFEYYSLGRRDITYYYPTFATPNYQHLWLSGSIIAGMKYDDLRIDGNFMIQHGAELNNRATTGPHTDPIVLLHGDFINQNKGTSGAAGTGIGSGDGMSPLDEHWILDAPGDTITWQGPGEVKRLTVTDGTVVSIRYQDHDHADSLMFLDSLNEEGTAHIIGKIFTVPFYFSALDDEHDFGNIGLNIRSGTEPYLENTRVVRVAGYDPPGNRIGVQSERTVKRYFNVIPSTGPQLGELNRLTFSVHPDEMNGAAPHELHFWKSTNGGQAWGPSGITSFDASNLTFVWDTASVGTRGTSNQFLWTLSTQREDIAVPVDLLTFTARIHDRKVRLDWQTSAEYHSRGFILERELDGLRERIASCLDVPELRAKSKYGAAYEFYDRPTSSGLVSYRLFELAVDGTETLLAVKSVEYQRVETGVPEIAKGANGKLAIRLPSDRNSDGIVEVYDVGGRLVMKQILPLGLSEEEFQLELPEVQGLLFVRFSIGSEKFDTRLLLRR